MTSNAALYSSQAPSLETFLRKLDGVSDIQLIGEEAQPTQYRFHINQVLVTMNVMPASKVASHLDGFCGYILHLHDIHPSPFTKPLLSKIQTIKTVIGCVIEPGWDDEGLVTNVLLTLNEYLDGLIFVNDSIIGPDGTPLVGPMAESSG